MQLSFLQAEEIGIDIAKIVEKSFIDTCTQTIDIPGYAFHWVQASLLHKA
ncbi:translation elongation factor P [Alicyclobacillus hesperidum URH17-3-68]|nr:translation elongation factor P [Alicyclobacillus hesperidum URH17-3-68]